MTEQEIWKDVVGYEGLYKVSNKGNVYSVARKDTMGRKCGGRTLLPVRNSLGYPCINLSKDGVTKQKKIHRLVLEAFVPNPNNYPEVNHRDEDKTNNNVKNLEWCDTRYNINYGTRTQKVVAKITVPVKGVHKKTGEEIYLKSMLEGALHGFNPSAISAVCAGRYRTHRGYSFQKIEKEQN